MTAETVRVLCVVEGWATRPMAQDAAERLVAAGYPDCPYGQHKIIPASEAAK